MSRNRFRERILTEAYSWSLNQEKIVDASDGTWLEIAHTPQFFSAGTMRVFNTARLAALNQKNTQLVLFLNDYLPAGALSSSRVFQMYSEGNPLKTPISLGCSSKEKDKAMNFLTPPSKEKIQHASETLRFMMQKEFKTKARKFEKGWEDRFNLEIAFWNTAAQNSSSLAEWFARLVHYHLGLLDSIKTQSLLVVPSSRFSTIFREPLHDFVKNQRAENPPPGWILIEGKRQRPKNWEQVLSSDWCPDVLMRQTLANHLAFSIRFNGRLKPYQSLCDEKSLTHFNIPPPQRFSVHGATEIEPVLFGSKPSVPFPFSLIYWIFGSHSISKSFSQTSPSDTAIITYEND